jgi:hypothetical protein
MDDAQVIVQAARPAEPQAAVGTNDVAALPDEFVEECPAGGLKDRDGQERVAVVEGFQRPGDRRAGVAHHAGRHPVAAVALV